MPHMTWTVAAERFDSPDANALRRDYYDEVASRYWQRPATAEEIDDGLDGDGAASSHRRPGSSSSAGTGAAPRAAPGWC